MAKEGFASVTLSDRTLELARRIEPFLLVRSADRRRKGSIPSVIEAALEELAKRLAADPNAIPLEVFGEEGPR